MRTLKTVGLLLIVALVPFNRELGAGAQCPDSVSGGGWFTPRSPNELNKTERVEFSFTAQGIQTNPNGTFNLVDRNTDLINPNGVQIDGVNVDRYEPLSPLPYGIQPCRIFWGNARLSTLPGAPLRYSVGVCDYGELGRDDRIRVTVCMPGTDCDTYGAANNGGGNLLGTLYFADNYDLFKTCPADAARCGDLDSGDIGLQSCQATN